MKNLFLVFIFSLSGAASALDISIGIGPGGVTITPGTPDRPGHREPRVCFYEDVGYQGRSFCVQAGAEDRNLDRSGWGDLISSIRIEGDASVQVFQDARFSGSSLGFDRSVPDIRRAGFFWNDVISSYRTVDEGYTPPPPSRGRVCFFEDVDFGGASFCLTPGQEKANLQRIGFDGNISSVSVEGRAEAYLYGRKNFNGQNKWVNRSVRNLREWSDRASSVQVVRGERP